MSGPRRMAALIQSKVSLVRHPSATTRVLILMICFGEPAMSEGLADRFRKWFTYEQTAHAKVVRSLETVPADRRQSPEYQKAVAWLSHLVMARTVWLGRLGVMPLPGGTLFPDKVELADVVADLRSIQERWSLYLATLSDEALSGTIEYKSIDGGRFRNSLEDILTQLFGHSSYHRGQIATLIRSAGGEPAATDYIYWCREPIPES
jgi:uncharacterized damage-inducible protein DinB